MIDIVVNQDLAEEEEGMGGYSLMTVFAMVGIAGLLFIWYRTDTLCSQTFGVCFYTAWVYWLFIVMAFVMGRSWWWYMRYRSPQFQANNIHDSCTGRKPMQCGDYYLVRLGGINFGVITDMFSTGTAIYPIAAHSWVGSNITANVRMEPRPKNELASSLRLFLDRNNCKNPYYFGAIDESQYKETIKAITDIAVE